MQEKASVTSTGAGWTSVAVSAVLFASALASALIVAEALFPSLRGLPDSVATNLESVAPCIMVGIAMGTLGYFVARGAIPGRSATDWGRARRIVIATFGIVCGLWASGPALVLADGIRTGTWNKSVLFDLVIPVAVFFCVRWSWPETLTLGRRHPHALKGDV